MTYRVVEKQLDWTGALHLCESLNGTLATVKTPFEQAYLTLLINSLRRPAWISLYNYGVSRPDFSASWTRRLAWRLCFRLTADFDVLRAAASPGWEKTRWCI